MMLRQSHNFSDFGDLSVLFSDDIPIEYAFVLFLSVLNDVIVPIEFLFFFIYRFNPAVILIEKHSPFIILFQ